VISRTVLWCARHHWIVIATALVLAGSGELARRALRGDVVPDLSDPQIGLVADWMGHPAPDVAREVTSVLTQELHDLPQVKAVRGSTMTGMAYVDVVFESDSDLDEARRAIADRVAIARSKLPANVRIQLGPAASSTSWVFEYALIDPGHVASPLDLRRFQEDVLRRALASIPGVAEVASVGGGLRQIRIDAKPRELRERGLAFSDLVATLKAELARRLGARNVSPEELETVPVSGLPNEIVRVGEVARVRLADDMQSGLADVAGFPAVGGIVIARRDANLATLIEEVKRTLDRERSRLPHRDADPARLDSGAAADVRLLTVYDRNDLAMRVRHTLLRVLGEEVGVVALIVLVFLLHGRSALVPLATLPVVVALTFGAMWLLGLPATIMSLGGIGIALGMAVDADVVALEASHRRLETASAETASEGRRMSIVRAAQSFAPAILTSLMITALSFLPVFAFTGETGRLLRPLALTKTLVIAAAALVTLTLAPALRDVALRGNVIPEFTNPLTRGLVRLYRPFVHFALTRPALTLATAVLAVCSCLPILSKLGGEFLPRVDEGDLLFMPTTQPGAPPDQAAVQLFWQDHAMSRFGEVDTVFGKVGRADTGTDPAPYSMAETTIRLRPRAEWPSVPRTRWYSTWAPEPFRRLLRLLWPEETPRTTKELVDKLDQTARLPGWQSAWTAPARARMDMMATGVRTPVGIRIVSGDPKRLDIVGTALRSVVARIPGTRSAVFESLGGETWLSFAADPAALALHGVDPTVVQAMADLIATGGQIGEADDDGRPVRVRIAPEAPDVQPRGPADQLREITVRSSGRAPGLEAGQPVPLALLGRPAYVQRPAVLRNERGELVTYVYIDLDDGVDVERYVETARREVERATAANEVRLDLGERLEWTGQYDLLAAGQRRLKWVAPIVAISMLALLWLQFRNLTESLIVLASVPFALVGSFWTLFLLSYPLSAPVWVGLLSTIGLAMQTGVVMVVYIDEAFYKRVREGRLIDRDDIVAAHAEGTVLRLRPKIMTVATMAASLLPLLWAEGAGAEIMKRVAAPMVGGLVTSAVLTLEVLPVIYTVWRSQQLRRAQRLGVRIEAVVGAAPAWASEGAASPRVEDDLISRENACRVA
jgi:Cu(I)/Ag(I) efflux system membrane protein CusA/SilA